MQDPSTYFNNQFPEHEILKCPRCDSSNTKFCYYNNYNLSQPRHYCKNCKRYWTKGGTLRNIPVGGASRKIAKRSSSNCKRPTTTATATADVPVASSSGPPANTVSSSNGKNQQQQQTFVGTSNSTSPASYLIESLYDQRMGMSIGMGMGIGMGGFGQVGQRDRVVDPKAEETNEEERFEGLETGDINCWSGSNNDWPDLAIYTPGAGGSAFQ